MPALILALLAALAPHAAAASWPDLARPAPPVGGGASDAAVVVGVENYDFVAPVPGARDNALAWYDYLNKTRGVPVGSIILLRDEDAIKESIAESAAKAAALAGPEGTLWFVFIGHGAPDAKGQDGLLVGVDAKHKAASVKARSLSQKELIAALSTSRAKTIAVVLDACFSGRDSGGRELVAGLQPLVPELAGAAVGPRFVVLSAARPDEYAGPLPGASRPAFSYLMLGALRGWADEDGDRRVTASEAQAYAASAFRAVVRDRTQNPTLAGGGSTVLAPSAGEKGPDIAEFVKAAPGAPEGPRGPSVGAAIEFRVSALPEIPAANAPSAKGLGAVPRAAAPGALGQMEGMDFGSLDVDSLERYDAAVRLEKTAIPPEEKAKAWEKLGREVAAYAEVASKRAREWRDFVGEEAFKSVLEYEKGDATPQEKSARWRELGGKHPRHAQAAAVRAAEWERYAAELKAAEEVRRRRAELRDKDWGKLRRILALSVVSDGDKGRFAKAFVEAYGKSPSDNPYVGELAAVLPAGTLTPGELKGLAASSDMSRIRAGEFQMGSPDGEGNDDEHPRHKVYLDAYDIDKREVSVAEYRRFSRAAGRAMREQPKESTDSHPVVHVDWNDAAAYCAWAGKRLPTEAEWEKAARGGTESKYGVGDDESLVAEHAWNDEKTWESPQPVGLKKPNQFGLYDMIGNAWEWVSDWHGEAYYKSSPDRGPKGPAEGTCRVLRGVVCPSCSDGARVANRVGNYFPNEERGYIGFRCASDPK